MSLQVMKALHTLLGAHVRQANRKKGSIQDAEVGAQTPQAGNMPPNAVQHQRPNPTLQGGQYNPGFTPLQGSRRVRPIQGGRPWYDN